MGPNPTSYFRLSLSRTAYHKESLKSFWMGEMVMLNMANKSVHPLAYFICF